MDGLAAATAAMDVTENGQITHAPATTATAWREALAAASTVPTHALSKSLLLKPKLAKTSEQVYILVVALEETETLQILSLRLYHSRKLDQQLTT